jgi:hypothetical protein
MNEKGKRNKWNMSMELERGSYYKVEDTILG